MVRAHIDLAWGCGRGDVFPVYFLPKNSILATQIKDKFRKKRFLNDNCGDVKTKKNENLCFTGRRKEAL